MQGFAINNVFEEYGKNHTKVNPIGNREETEILTKFFFKFQEYWHPLLSEEIKTMPRSSDLCCAFCALFKPTTRLPSVIQHNFSQALWEFRSLLYYIPKKLWWVICKHRTLAVSRKAFDICGCDLFWEESFSFLWQSH